MGFISKQTTPERGKNGSLLADLNLVPAKQVAHYFGVKPETLMNWAAAGEFPKPQYVGHRIHWRQSDIDAHVATMAANLRPTRKRKRTKDEDDTAEMRQVVRLDEGDTVIIHGVAFVLRTGLEMRLVAQ